MKMTATHQHHMTKFVGLISAFFISAVLWIVIIGAVKCLYR